MYEKTCDVDPVLERDAESERLASLAGIKPNPWPGAMERLKAAQAEAKRESGVVRDGELKATADRLAAAFQQHCDLRARKAETKVELDANGARLAGLSEAQRRNRAYSSWLLSPNGQDEELGRRCGQMSPAHFLANVTEAQKGEMRLVRELEVQREALLQRADSTNQLISRVESEHPELTTAVQHV